MLTDSDGVPVVIEPRIVKSKVDGLAYLEQRDEYRIKDGKDPCWRGANIIMHHRLMGRSNRIGDRVITQRRGLIKR